MRRVVAASVILLASALPVSAFAETITQTASRPLTCADFRRNADGSWSPTHPIGLNGVSFGPGVSFNPGVSFGGIDLASALNQQCPLQ
jgi:hypothetical protein